MWKPSFIFKVAQFLSSMSYLLFHFNLWVKALSILLITNSVFSYVNKNKHKWRYIICTCLVWIIAMLFSIITVAYSNRNASCSFDTITRLPVLLLYVFIPFIVHSIIVVFCGEDNSACKVIKERSQGFHPLKIIHH